MSVFKITQACGDNPDGPIISEVFFATSVTSMVSYFTDNPPSECNFNPLRRGSDVQPSVFIILERGDLQRILQDREDFLSESMPHYPYIGPLKYIFSKMPRTKENLAMAMNFGAYNPLLTLRDQTTMLPVTWTGKNKAENMQQLGINYERFVEVRKLVLSCRNHGIGILEFNILGHLLKSPPRAKDSPGEEWGFLESLLIPSPA